MFCVLGGIVLTALLRFVLGTFDGEFAAACAAAVLGVAATAFGILGLRSVLGRLGVAIAAATLILLGNPLSGLASSPELLPVPWGAIGQALPPGATGTLLRNIVFFEGHGIAYPMAVLSAWLAGGLVLFVVGTWRGHIQSGLDGQPNVAASAHPGQRVSPDRL